MKYMAKLNFWHQTAKQQMLIEADYNPIDDHVQDIEVFILEDGKIIAEISKLLDDAEGDPLIAMIEAIDWREMYHDTQTEKIRA
jgi:hypothetical protein